MKALLALEDGRTFPCKSFTGPGEAGGEIVFNTAMTGYQEVLTDPSYRGQMVTMTYPLIGNYGVNPDDVESARIQVSAFLVHEYQDFPSNYRSTKSLSDYLKTEGVLGVEGLDTRAVTRHIRNTGAMRAMISTADTEPESLVSRARRLPDMTGRDLATTVTTTRAYRWKEGRPSPLFPGENHGRLDRSVFRRNSSRLTVVAFDFGIKFNILRRLTEVGFEVVVVPAGTAAAAVRAMAPDGVFLANGPGDPEPLTEAVRTIGDLCADFPIFGICLGHQLLGLAMGGRTYKLKFGHRGANQPVKNLRSGRIEITSQNHGFAVDPESLPASDTEITHVNLNDDTLEGFRHRKLPVIAVQYHPEASPGPHDAAYLFQEFAATADKHRRR